MQSNPFLSAVPSISKRRKCFNELITQCAFDCQPLLLCLVENGLTASRSGRIGNPDVWHACVFATGKRTAIFEYLPVVFSHSVAMLCKIDFVLLLLSAVQAFHVQVVENAKFGSWVGRCRHESAPKDLVSCIHVRECIVSVFTQRVSKVFGKRAKRMALRASFISIALGNSHPHQSEGVYASPKV